MNTLPGLHLQDYELLARYTLDGDESVVQGIVGAFESLDVGTKDQERVLHDVVDSDALNQLQSTDNRHVRVSLKLWGYPVVITPEDVSVYGQLNGTP